MTGAPANKAILRGVFDETAKGNGRPFVEALDADVVWTIIGSTDWSRRYTGKRAVLSELLGPLSDQLDGANTIVADRLIAEDDWVAVEGHGENRTRAGKTYRNRYCWTIRMAGGKIVDVTEYADTQLIATALEAPRMRTPE
ncbi:MAG: nuclear transport factor 2 family protein [Sphingomonas sp.]